jgi:dCMP deaminase
MRHEDQINKWDHRFMELARVISTWSKDRSTKVGCVIVGVDRELRSSGFNGFPRRVDDEIDERHQRPAKYAWTEHAERNAIYNAARLGVSLQGCTMYLPWFPCMDCARAIVQCGIAELVAIEPNVEDPRWGSDFRSALLLFHEAGVHLRWYCSTVIEATPVVSGSSSIAEGGAGT